MPLERCSLLFVVGVAAWLIVFGHTKWTADGWWVTMPVLMVDMYLVALAVSLLPRVWRQVALVMVYVLIYVLGFAESFLYERFFMHFNPQTLTMVLETNDGEASGFVDMCLQSKKLWPTLLWWLGLLACHIGAIVGRWWLERKRPALLQGMAKWAARVVVPLCAIGLVWWIPQRVEIARFLAIDRTDRAEQTDLSVFYSPQWRVVYAMKFEQLSRQELQTLAHNMQQIGPVESRDGVPQIVLVIGESHNKHHSAVYGYGLPTTPFQTLSERAGLMVAMDDAVTPWNVTSSVFKQMLSTHSSDQEGLWTDGVLFPALIRQAGYKTAFISNQFYKSNRQNSANYNGSFYLNSEPFDSLCFNYRNTKYYLYDRGLLKELQGLPRDSMQFVIFHLLGQHMPYAERVPSDGKQFLPNDIKRLDLSAQERQIVADYDNATLANDQLLERVYDLYKDREAVIVYLADHGDEVFDGNMRMYGRNHSAQPTSEIMWAEFEVPMEVWVTPTLQQTRPELMERLKAAKQRPFSIDDVSHLLLNLAGVQTKYYNPERDLLSPQFKARPRPVKGTKVTYDQIMNKKQ